MHDSLFTCTFPLAKTSLVLPLYAHDIKKVLLIGTLEDSVDITRCYEWCSQFSVCTIVLDNTCNFLPHLDIIMNFLGAVPNALIVTSFHAVSYSLIISIAAQLYASPVHSLEQASRFLRRHRHVEINRMHMDQMIMYQHELKLRLCNITMGQTILNKFQTQLSPKRPREDKEFTSEKRSKGRSKGLPCLVPRNILHMEHPSVATKRGERNTRNVI